MGGPNKPRRDASKERVVDTITHAGMDYEKTACGKIYALFLSRIHHGPPTEPFITRRWLKRDGPVKRKVSELFAKRRAKVR